MNILINTAGQTYWPLYNIHFLSLSREFKKLKRIKGYTNLRTIRRQVTAILLLASLSASFIPYAVFHQHNYESQKCVSEHIEFISLLDSLIKNNSENPCKDHNAHYATQSTICDQCDFIYNASFLLGDIGRYEAIHRTCELKLNPIPVTNIEIAYSTPHSRGSPIC